MRNLFSTLVLSSILIVVACNESRRGNDSNVNEDRAEAAEESNADKFDNKKKNDADFVFDVVESSYAEIKLAQIAAQRSTDRSIKAIATAIIDDHTKALNELKVLAQAKAISIPVQETGPAKDKLERFSDMSAEDFDKNWCKEMMDIHDNKIDQFEKGLDRTDDPELKAWIEKTLGALRTHHEKTEACYNKAKET